MVGQVLTLLAPIEAAIPPTLSGKREGSDVMRIHLSHVYRLLSESSRPPSTSTPTSSTPSLTERALRWVDDSHAFLAITGNEFRWDLLELRRHFCVVVERMAVTTAPTDGLPCPLSEPLRRRLFSLLLAWCGHGPSSASYSAKVDRHAEELLSKVKASGGQSASQRQTALRASYTVEVKAFRLCALSAMAGLLQAPVFDEALLREVGAGGVEVGGLDGVGLVVPWLNAVLMSGDAEVRDVAYRALEGLILSNPFLLPHLLDQCYHHHSLLARRYFLVIAQLLLIQCAASPSSPPSSASSAPSSPTTSTSSSSSSLPFGLGLSPLLHLLLFKLGDSSYNVRAMALRLLPSIESKYSHLPTAPASHLSSIIVGSHLADTYRQVQTSLSTRLALTFSGVSDAIVLEALRRIAVVRSIDAKCQLLLVPRPLDEESAPGGTRRGQRRLTRGLHGRRPLAVECGGVGEAVGGGEERSEATGDGRR